MSFGGISAPNAPFPPTVEIFGKDTRFGAVDGKISAMGAPPAFGFEREPAPNAHSLPALRSEWTESRARGGCVCKSEGSGRVCAESRSSKRPQRAFPASSSAEMDGKSRSGRLARQNRRLGADSHRTPEFKTPPARIPCQLQSGVGKNRLLGAFAVTLPSLFSRAQLRAAP